MPDESKIPTPRDVVEKYLKTIKEQREAEKEKSSNG